MDQGDGDDQGTDVRQQARGRSLLKGLLRTAAPSTTRRGALVAAVLRAQDMARAHGWREFLLHAPQFWKWAPKIKRGVAQDLAPGTPLSYRMKASFERGSGMIRTEGWRAFLRRAFQLSEWTAQILDDQQVPLPDGYLTGEFRPFSLPAVDSPRVSIVIPVFNQAKLTYNCLLAVLENSDAIPYEVIVVDDCSTDDTEHVLSQVANLRVLRNERNLGFIKSCNTGAKEAAGEFLVLLNNDTKVQRGWLDALVETAQADPAAGVVGAKLLYPNGLLQEAGSIVFRDGSGWNYGRNDDPDRPQYNFVREVDYCSAACVLIVRELWERVGGFDEGLAPAYYEDTDFAFASRALGKRVLYQPRARVVHFEGASSGRDTGSGVKSYQPVNQGKFVAKWADELRARAAHGSALQLARYGVARPQALVIDHAVPRHDRDSGSLRMFSLLRLLVEIGFNVTFVPENRTRHEPYTSELQQMGVEVMYGHENIGALVRGLAPRLRLALLSRPDVARNQLKMVRRNAPDALVLYDTVDLHFLREERRAKVQRSSSAERAASRYRQLELGLMAEADATLVVSEDERRLLADEAPDAVVHVLPNVHQSGLTPGLSSRHGPEPAARHGLVFVGSFAHPPNPDAIVYFVREVMPLIRRALPDVRLSIVGAEPPPDVRALAKEPNVDVLGWVQDLRGLLDRSRVSVAPLRFGAGLKGKVGESMAAGLPVVSTSIGAEGMDVTDACEIMIADDAEAFATKVVRLYTDDALWRSIAENGSAYATHNYSAAAVKGRLLSILAHHDLTGTRAAEA